MKVGLKAPELVDRKPDAQSGVSGRHLTTWRGEFDGAPDRWWREAFAMWAGEVLQGICIFSITTEGYEFECGEDQIEDITEKLVTAAVRAEPTAARNRAKEKKHSDTLALFRKVEELKRELLAQAEAAGKDAARRELQERMARKFKSLEQ